MTSLPARGDCALALHPTVSHNNACTLPEKSVFFQASMDIMFDPSVLGCIGGISVGVFSALMAGAVPGLTLPALAANGGWRTALLTW